MLMILKFYYAIRSIKASFWTVITVSLVRRMKLNLLVSMTEFDAGVTGPGISLFAFTRSNDGRNENLHIKF